MAKIFGYNYNSSSKYPHLNLKDMQNAFNIDFKLCKSIRNKQIGVSVGVLNKYDCHPVMLKNGHIELIFMGKIFNVKEERNLIFRNILSSIKSDDKKLLIRTLRNINGLFFLLIYNSKVNQVFIINDRYGMEPLYYYHDQNKLLFASEIKSVLSDKTIKKEVNWDFWRDFFQYGFAIGDKTPFNNIYKMPNSSILSFYNRSLRISKYWDYTEIKINYDLSEEAVIDLGIKVLKNVFKRQSTNLKKCIVFLSGGYDSRCISGSLKYFTKVSFENFSTSLHPSGEIESTLAKNVSNKLGVRNNYIGEIKDLYPKYFKSHFLQVDGLCTEHMWVQPLVDSIKNPFPNFDGIGGDVLLRNVSATKKNIDLYHNNDKSSNLLDKEMIAYWSGYGCQNIYKYFYSKVSKKLKPSQNSVKKEIYKISNCENKIIIFYLLNRTRNVAQLAARNLIARKVYSYFPFFDNEFVEYSLSIPPKMKYFDNIYLKILKKVFPAIMEVPTTNDKTIKTQIQNTLTGVLGWYYFSKILTMYKRILLIINPKMLLGKDLQYLLTLSKTLNMPPFLDRSKIIKQVENDIHKRNNPKLYLTKILQFCTWYNEYFPNSHKLKF